MTAAVALFAVLTATGLLMVAVERLVYRTLARHDDEMLMRQRLVDALSASPRRVR